MVLGEMLALGRLKLGELETELAGAPRPPLRKQLPGGDGTRGRTGR